jgi:hypothetical protein
MSMNFRAFGVVMMLLVICAFAEVGAAAMTHYTSGRPVWEESSFVIGAQFAQLLIAAIGLAWVGFSSSESTG